MGIKLKNSSALTKSVMTAFVVCLIMTFLFLAYYPWFESKADQYYENGMESDEILSKMYESNFVLYKELQEKITESKKTFDGIYLNWEDKVIEMAEMDEGVEIDVADIKSYKQQIINNLNENMANWNNRVKEGIGQEMDYCVVDEVTGKVVKNTGRNIEKLDSGLEENPYVYYLKLTYDSGGNLRDLSAKSKTPDNLIKNAQRVLAEPILANQNNYFDGQSSTTIYSGVMDYGKVKRTTATLGMPKSVTFIYALTKQQEEKLLAFDYNNDLLSYQRNVDDYYKAGVASVYHMMLLITALIAFLLSLRKGYVLHQCKGVRIPVEVSVIGIFILQTQFRDYIVRLVSDTSTGYLRNSVGRYLPEVGDGIYALVLFVINISFIFFLFTMWFYFVTTLLEVKVNGLRVFLSERSIMVYLYRGWNSKIKAIMKRWNDEVLHVDLTEKSKNTLKKIAILNGILLFVVCTMWVVGWFVIVFYSVVVYFIMKRYLGKLQSQYKNLLKATGSIADGNLNVGFEEDLGVFESYKGELYKIQKGFKRAVDEEVKSQKMKTELITNVSHDLKTPLTAITTYIDLLKEENITEQQRKEYLEVIERKSLRLKFLIEDLFEVSKANSGNVTMNIVDVDICNLMRQVYLEFEDQVEAAEVVFRFRVPEERIVLKLDSQKTYRIFANLYSNIIKYALPHTRAYVDAVKTERGIRIELKNISAEELSIETGALTERFVRGDGARNTEGNGLGLAIAKSFVELQHGKLKLDVDGDLFKVILEW